MIATEIIWVGRFEGFTPRSKTVIDVLRELIIAKRAANKSRYYIHSLQQYLGAWSADIQHRPIASIVAADIERWFDSRNEALSSRYSNLGRISALFSFAVRRGYITENPCDRIERVFLEPKPPVILSVQQAKHTLLFTSYGPRQMLAYMVLGMFCGVRPYELLHLTWDSIDLQRGRVEILISKVRRRRIVKIPENALEWISLCDKEKPLINCLTITKRKRAIICEAVGWKWTQDILRHTAASYMLGLHGDANYVSSQLGNSPKILMTHYHEVVKPEDAEAFFAIRP